MGIHDAGYIHRDLKHDNILLTNTNTASCTSFVLIDYGLSTKYLIDGNHC